MDTRKMISNFVKDNPTVPQLKFIQEDPETVIIEELSGDGILNFVYKVSSADGVQSVVLKYGKDTAKYKEDDKIPYERQTREYETMKTLISLAPGLAPTPYCLDEHHHIIAMEDLSHMHLQGEDLEEGVVDAGICGKLGQMIGRLHATTRPDTCDEETRNKLIKLYGDPTFSKDRVEYRLDRAFSEEEGLIKLNDNTSMEKYRQYMEELTSQGILQSLRKLASEPHCVIHGDCHPKSVFVLGDTLTIFDLEWTFLGNPAYDVGFILSWYVMFMMAKARTNQAEHMKQQTIQAIHNFWKCYMAEVEEEESTFISAVAGFTGATIFSLTYFIWLDQFVVVDNECKLAMLDVGMKLMRQYHNNTCTSIQNLVHVITDTS